MTPKKRIEPLLIMGLSLVFGMLFWIIDSYFEYRFFHQNLSFLLLEGPETFLESLVTKVPSHSLFVRTSFMVAALLGGVLTAVFLRIKAKSDERIRESDEKHRNIFDTARDAIIVFNLDTGKILDVNKYACDLYGYDRQELLSISYVDLSAEPEKTIAVI